MALNGVGGANEGEEKRAVKEGRGERGEAKQDAGS